MWRKRRSRTWENGGEVGDGVKCVKGNGQVCGKEKAEGKGCGGGREVDGEWVGMCYHL